MFRGGRRGKRKKRVKRANINLQIFIAARESLDVAKCSIVPHQDGGSK